MTQFIGALVSGLAIGGIVALLALGYVIVYRSTHTLNFAQGSLLVLERLAMPSRLKKSATACSYSAYSAFVIDVPLEAVNCSQDEHPCQITRRWAGPEHRRGTAKCSSSR